jgi:hypothetical protein
MFYPLDHLRNANHAHEASKFLVTDLLVMLTQEIALSLTPVPSSPAELSELLHSRGINMRYIGLLCEYAKEYQTEHFKTACHSRFLQTSEDVVNPYIWRHDLSAWINLLEMEMIARGAKHTLRALFSAETALVKDETGKRKVLGWGEKEAAWLLNVLFMGPASAEQLEAIMKGDEEEMAAALDGLPSPMVVLQTLKTQIQQRYLTTPSIIFEDYLMKADGSGTSNKGYLDGKYIINSSSAYNPYALLQWVCYHCHFSIAPSPKQASLAQNGTPEFTSYFEFINPTTVNDFQRASNARKGGNKGSNAQGWSLPPFKPSKQQLSRKQKQKQRNDVSPSEQLAEQYREYASESKQSPKTALREHAPILPSSSFGLSHYLCSGFAVEDIVAIYPTNKRVISSFRITAATASNNSLGGLVRDNHNKPAFHHTHARGSAAFNRELDERLNRPKNEFDRASAWFSFYRHLPSEAALYKKVIDHADDFSQMGLTQSYSALGHLEHFNAYLYVPTGSSSSVNHHQYFSLRLGKRLTSALDEMHFGRVYTGISKLQNMIERVRGTLGPLHPFTFYLLFQYTVVLRDLDHTQEALVQFRNLRDANSLVLPSYSVDASKYNLSLTNLMMEINPSLAQYGTILQLFKNLQFASPKPNPTSLVHFTKTMTNSMSFSCPSDAFGFLFRMYAHIQDSNVQGEDLPHLIHALEVIRRGEGLYALTNAIVEEGGSAFHPPYLNYMLSEEVMLNGVQIEEDESRAGRGLINLPMVQAFNLPFFTHIGFLKKMENIYRKALEHTHAHPHFFTETPSQLVQDIETEIRQFSNFKISDKCFLPLENERDGGMERRDVFLRDFGSFAGHCTFGYAAKMDN